MALYDMTQDVPQEGNGSAYLEPGIYENIVLTDVLYNESRNGNKFLAFYFSDENGNQVPKTEWEPRGENLESKVSNQLARIKHIAVNSGILSKDEFVFKADDFEQFAKQVVDKLKSKQDQWEKHKLRIKVVYDFNDYSTLPSYVRHSWLESMDIPSEQSKIKILPAIDKMERERPDTSSGQSSSPNPFEEESNTQEQGDSETTDEDAPF